MNTLHQSPTDPAFVQNPYWFYAAARAHRPLHYWAGYKMVAAFDHDTVRALLRDRRFGREAPPESAASIPDHLTGFYAIEMHSLLDAEPPRHTRLRSLILRAFTSRRIAALETEITTVCHDLIDRFPDQPFNLLDAYCSQIPVITIARLLGVPLAMCPQLLSWSHAMVGMYQASRTRTTEDAAETAATEFATFIRSYINQRRLQPRDDLITHLITAEQQNDKLSTDELITTCILLLNAGHKATVHAISNGVKTLLEQGTSPAFLRPDRIDSTIEEILRFDPPLHMFTRYAYEPITLHGYKFARGDQIALLLGAANRDPAIWTNPDRFDPSRRIKTNTSFGGGLHFCVGAALARLEMKIALPALIDRCPDLTLTSPPQYSGSYHFHGLTRLMATTSP